MAKSKKTGDPKIAARLRAAREAAGYVSVEDAVAHLDLEPGYRHHENATRAITIQNAVRYCEMYEINLVWLATGDGPMLAGTAETPPPARTDVLAGLRPRARTQVLNLISLLRDEAAE